MRDLRRSRLNGMHRLFSALLPVSRDTGVNYLDTDIRGNQCLLNAKPPNRQAISGALRFSCVRGRPRQASDVEAEVHHVAILDDVFLAFQAPFTGFLDTDFEKGFIRAEVIAYDDFIQYKGEAGAKEAGKWRLEGKEYIVKDGDVMHFRFNV